MGKRNLSLMMGAAVLAVYVFGAGCSRKLENLGEGAARISVSKLAYSDTTKVNVTIESDTSGAPGTGAVIPKPIVVPLGKKPTGENWSTTAQGIPSGRVKYTGNAYQGSTVIFTGSVLGVITAGNTASVTLNLFQATPNTFANNAPVISALQIGTTAATPGQVVAVNVAATDPDVGDTLTYAWTATCGTFAVASSASTTWTAPASSSAPCVLTVAVTDNHGASNTATASISVSASNKGGVAITVVPDLAPVITGINVNVTDTATPPVAAAFVTGNVANLSVQATDDGSIASTLWSANAACTGAFSNVAIANPTFTVSAAAGVSCQFTVVVTDDKGQSTTGTLVLPVVQGAGTSVAAPVIEVYSNSSDNVAPGQVISFYVVASQLNHDGLTFAWTGNPGSAAPMNQIDSVDPATATPSSQITYTAPVDLGSPSSPVVITVTVTDTANTLVATHVWNLGKANDPCANNAPTTTVCDDGNACTQSDHCNGAGQCVGASPVVCTAADACHSVGTCNAATGSCSTPYAPSGTTCSDDNACTQNDTCNGLGTCAGGPAVVCPAASDACHVAGTCSPATGCSLETPAPEGATCSDSNLCTTGEACHLGVCNGGSSVTCPVATDACHVVGSCVAATGCPAQVPGNDGVACTSTDLCVQNTVCAAGTCSGTPKCAAPLTCDASTGNCIAPACMQPTLAKDWALNSTVALASDANGKIYSTGVIYGPFNFTNTGNTRYGADQDVYVAGAIDPATGFATWAADFGDATPQAGVGVAVSQPMVGVIGNYQGTMTGASVIPANTGDSSVDFILGLNPSNGSPVWGKKTDLLKGGLTTISSNPTLSAFVVCGTVGTTSTVLGSAGATDLVTGAVSGGGSDILVAKINAADGTVAWARQIGGTSLETCNSATFDDAGNNVYLAGTYSGYDNSGCVLPGAVSDGTFLTCCTTRDAIAIGATCPADAGPVNFGTGAFPIAASNQARIWVAQLSGSTGATIIAQTWGTNGRQIPSSLIVDASGSVLLGGSFLSSIPFGGTAGTITSTGSTDAFLVKFSSSLVPTWAHSWGGGTSGQQGIRSVATDSNGNIFAAGFYGVSINLGPGGTAIASKGNSDAFTVKLTSAGAVTCAATYGDSAGQTADSIAVARLASGANKDKAMFAGSYAGTMVVGPTSLNTGDPGVSHAYIAAINENSF